MAAVERIDAAVRADEPDLARGWADELAGFAEATGRPWALATVAYGRALTADGADEADALFQEALSQHARAGRPLDEARTQLAYGEWLRRAQRRVDARRAPAARPGDLPGRCAPKRSPTARPRSCAPPARPPASATPPPW